MCSMGVLQFSWIHFSSKKLLGAWEATYLENLQQYETQHCWFLTCMPFRGFTPLNVVDESIQLFVAPRCICIYFHDCSHYISTVRLHYYPRQTCHEPFAYLTQHEKQFNQWARKTLKTQAIQSEVGLQVQFTCWFSRAVRADRVKPKKNMVAW